MPDSGAAVSSAVIAERFFDVQLPEGAVLNALSRQAIWLTALMFVVSLASWFLRRMPFHWRPGAYAIQTANQHRHSKG